VELDALVELSAELVSDEQQLNQARQGLAAANLNLSTLDTCVSGVQQAVSATQAGNQQAAIAAITSVADPCETLQGNSPGGPVFPFDFPDPDVIDVAGTYFAYGTNSAEGNIQIITSTDLSTWTPLGNALPSLPSWAKPDSTWAPSVILYQQNYLLYYAVDDGSEECISVGVAAAPTGPFVDTSTAPLVCHKSLGGSIHPAPYLVGTTLYLTWKSNGESGQPATIWAEQLAPPGTTLAPATTPAQLLIPSQLWEDSNVEAPFMWDQAGTWYLFYSGSNWNSATYAEGVAVCKGPLGPCTKPLDGPIYAAQPDLVSPGGGSVFAESQGNVWIAFHAYLPDAVGYPNARLLFLRRLTFSGGVPQVMPPS
jgi:beta-xylosidase